MKNIRWQITLGILLIALAMAIYLLQIYIFNSPRDTYFYLFQDLAFVPIQVLLVTVIVDQFLRIRDRIALLKKLNMVIGAFFSEVGTQFLRYGISFSEDVRTFGDKLIIKGFWIDQHFLEVIKEVKNLDGRIDCGRGDLEELKSFLTARRSFLLGLLENQNLLEHETFTELLWAVFHLMEELSYRSGLHSLTKADSEHIAGDFKRAYVKTITEWLSYMHHLKSEYPYLFSLAVRLNPFDPHASVEVQ